MYLYPSVDNLLKQQDVLRTCYQPQDKLSRHKVYTQDTSKMLYTYKSSQQIFSSIASIYPGHQLDAPYMQIFSARYSAIESASTQDSSQMLYTYRSFQQDIQQQNQHLHRTLVRCSIHTNLLSKIFSNITSIYTGHQLDALYIQILSARYSAI